MSRWFNTAGPCQSDKNYMLAPTDRLPQVERLIAQESYFVIHAPRQTGKTTAMLALAKQLTESGRYTAVMLSVEVGAPFKDDINQAEEHILSAWEMNAQVRLPPDLQPPAWSQFPAGSRIKRTLQLWTQQSPRPLVVFIDEIDALQDQVLLSVLRQLRDGYPNRPEGFPQSLALIGLRDVRDDKIASGGSDRLHTASPFNIKVRVVSCFQRIIYGLRRRIISHPFGINVLSEYRRPSHYIAQQRVLMVLSLGLEFQLIRPKMGMF